MADRHIAHFNWAMLRAPEGDPQVQAFFDGVDRVNQIAERAPGFVWRNGCEGAQAKSIGWELFDGDRTIASFSTWESPEALWHFVHKTLHGAFLKRGETWFQNNLSYNYALWWVDPGHVPDIAEARSRVEALRAQGPSDAVFTFADLPATVRA